MLRSHPIWYGLGFTIIPLLVLALGYFHVNPQFYRDIPSSFGVQNDATQSSINWNEEERVDPPLEYVADSFKGTRISTEVVEVTSFWSLWNAPRSQVEYEWRYKVKNLTETRLEISVTYMLEGSAEAVIDQSTASKVAEPGETVELEGASRIDYQDAKRVRGSTWSIGSRKRP